MTDRFVTIYQPWASAIFCPVRPKTVENRSGPIPSTLPQWSRCDACDRRTAPGKHDWIRHHGLDTPRPWVTEPAHQDEDHRTRPDGPFPFPLWIHASARVLPYKDAWWAYDRLTDGGRWEGWAPDSLPDVIERGVLLGPVTVTSQHEAEQCADFDSFVERVCIDDGEWVHHPTDPGDCHTARYCTVDAMPDHWHWIFDPASAELLPHPIRLRGQQGMPYLPDDVREAAEDQLRTEPRTVVAS